jgi:hypothetical protein
VLLDKHQARQPGAAGQALSRPACPVTTAATAIYRVVVTAALPPDEIRVAAETHREVAPEYRDAVIESFLEKVGREIDARVDARLAQQQAQSPARQHGRPGSPFALAIGSIVLGIPLSAIVVSAGHSPPGFWGLLVVWIAIAAINIVYNANHSKR